MKKINYILLLCLITNLRILYAQQSGCYNSDFESSPSFTAGWTGATGNWSPSNVVMTNGIVNGRHTIMNAPGFDPFTNNNVPFIAPGGTCSARIGNTAVSYSYNNGFTESLSYTFTVTPQSNLFIYKYAVVLEDPDASHSLAEVPCFEIDVYNQNNQLISCGGHYEVSAQSGIPGFSTYITNGRVIRYRNWSAVGVDCSAMSGQTVKIVFKTFDCSPGAHFGYAYVDAFCRSLSVDVDYCTYNNSTVLKAPIGFQKYKWSNGASTRNITVSNPVNGATYSCVLTSYTGCTVAISTTLTPTVMHPQFTTANVCYNDVVFVDSSKSISGPPITKWKWSFGDGNTSTDPSPTHSYAAWGNYNVRLITTSANGCKDTVEKNITAYPLPKADFSTTNVCINTPAFLNNQSQIDTGSIALYKWNMGDSTVINNNGSHSHNYNSAGLYTVQLLTTSEKGCADSITKIIQVYDLPQPQFSTSVTEGCQPLQVMFANNSTSANGAITGFEWLFGNNDSSTNSNPNYTFNNAGQHNVTLTATSTLGCKNTLTKNNYILVNPKPIAGFTHDPVSPTIFNPLVFFKDASTGADAWHYTFGDNTFSFEKSPQYTYLNWGSFNITQIVTTNYGCADTIMETLVIDSAFTCYIPNAFTPNNDNKNEYFTCNGIGIKNYQLQIYNRWGEQIFNGNNISWFGKQNNNLVPTGAYVYVFTITDIFNKKHKKEGTVTVFR